MKAQPPVAKRPSADLERMQELLEAIASPAPITIASSFSAHKLDVAACYDHLNNSKTKRPEDLVMRQALELYCSLMSPPTSPAGDFKSEHQSEQNQAARVAVLPSGIFTCEDEYDRSTMIKLCNYEPTSDSNRPFGYGPARNYASAHSTPYVPQADQTHFSWSTPSCVSDHENSDTDDMDDPFACYPLSHPRRTTPQAYHPQINYDHHRRSSYEVSSLHKRTTSYSSQKQRIQISAQPSVGQLEGLPDGMNKAVTAEARNMSNRPWPNARRSFFSPTVEPLVATVPKASLGRKRAFSVAGFVKQRKAPPMDAGSLRISGPMPIAQVHTSSSPSSGTFSVPVKSTRFSAARLSSAGSLLSPALELNEDLSPIHPKPSHSRLPPPAPPRPSTDDVTPLSLKLSSRPEPKSLWKVIKTSTSLSNFAIERPLVI
ncbi:hypothetical protein VP01_763g4 [Puccinia sorghi]|uniref:Uncharacterized protein n=1 Tax=Puccinia sorghi TaxID=27349 RepID=A0A0L6UBV1_9BASI|nr:hypothetical protein VP01_763g4 [Puccinia sorghi]